MANQKPVDEIRIGRVKATIWQDDRVPSGKGGHQNGAYSKDLGKNNLFILQEDATLDEWRTLTPLLRWERSFRPSAP